MTIALVAMENSPRPEKMDEVRKYLSKNSPPKSIALYLARATIRLYPARNKQDENEHRTELMPVNPSHTGQPWGAAAQKRCAARTRMDSLPRVHGLRVVIGPNLRLRLPRRRSPRSERSAARLAHQSGGLGVASSNLAAPTKLLRQISRISSPPRPANAACPQSVRIFVRGLSRQQLSPTVAVAPPWLT